MKGIVSAFTETENRNLRIIRSWVFSFKKIYATTTKFYKNSKYYEDILNDFLHYSIWVAGALKKNKKITHSANYGSQDMACFEGHEYNYIFRYSFIDAWINRDVWDDKDLCQACKSIIKRREQEDVDDPPKIHSTGEALAELRDWYFMDDKQVRKILEKLVHEVEEGKYAYYDYSNILLSLLYLQANGLFTGDINHIQTIMIDMIKNDSTSLDTDTVLSYVNALKRIFVVEESPAWNPNLRSKIATRTSDTRYFVDPSIGVAALGMGPNDLINDLKTFGLMFESLCIRDLRVYAEANNGKVYHYRDSSDLECDAVIHLRDGSYGLIEIKLGGDKLIQEGAENIIKLFDKIDTETMKNPSFMMVITATGNYAYKREDGVFVVPIGCLKD